MEKYEKITTEMQQTFLELEKYADTAKDRIRGILRGLSIEDMIGRINELHLSDKSLNFLCEGIALETEDFEICAAVQQIKKELQALEIRQAAYSPISYYLTSHEHATPYLHLASS